MFELARVFLQQEFANSCFVLRVHVACFQLIQGQYYQPADRSFQRELLRCCGFEPYFHLTDCKQSGNSICQINQLRRHLGAQPQLIKRLDPGRVNVHFLFLRNLLCYLLRGRAKFPTVFMVKKSRRPRLRRAFLIGFFEPQMFAKCYVVLQCK